MIVVDSAKSGVKSMTGVFGTFTSNDCSVASGVDTIPIKRSLKIRMAGTEEQKEFGFNFLLQLPLAKDREQRGHHRRQWRAVMSHVSKALIWIYWFVSP